MAVQNEVAKFEKRSMVTPDDGSSESPSSSPSPFAEFRNVMEGITELKHCGYFS